MTNTEKIFVMMLGTAMLVALSSDRCDDALTKTEQRELTSLATQFIQGDPTVTPEQEKLVNKIMDRNGIAH